MKIKYLLKTVFYFSLCLILICCGTDDNHEASKIDPYNQSIDDTNNYNDNENSNIPQGTVPNVSGSENGHDYVDLGLSVKWATCNIGASSPENYGGYFAWGENITKSFYDYSNYTFTVRDKPGFHFTKVNVITATNYDAAAKNWGGSWRIPKSAEFNELIEKCTSKWMVYKGVLGRMFTARNGNSIFFPASGEYDDDAILGRNEFGEYWTGELRINYNSSNTDNPYSGAWSFYFSDDRVILGEGYRSLGKSIRPVYSVSGGSGESGGGNNGGSSSDVPYITNFNSTSTKNSISVKFMSSETPTDATIYYGEYSATKALNTTISGKQISAKATGLKSGTKYYFKCTVKNKQGSSTSSEYPAMTNY
jgi:hypothetical protein